MIHKALGSNEERFCLWFLSLLLILLGGALLGT
jgi:hypothetical protein